MKLRSTFDAVTRKSFFSPSLLRLRDEDEISVRAQGRAASDANAPPLTLENTAVCSGGGRVRAARKQSR